MWQAQIFVNGKAYNTIRFVGDTIIDVMKRAEEEFAYIKKMTPNAHVEVKADSYF